MNFFENFNDIMFFIFFEEKGIWNMCWIVYLKIFCKHE